MPSEKSLTERLRKLAEEVEKKPDYKEAATNRTKEGKITLAFVEPFDG